MKKSRANSTPSSTTMLDKGLTVLEAVERARRPVNIQELASATGIQRLAVSRLLQTLEQRGYVERGADKRYQALTRRRRIQVAYIAPLAGNQFRVDVTQSLEAAAMHAGVQLVLLDNDEQDGPTALRNADTALDSRVDVVIFFQPVESVGHMLADRLFRAGIPFITVERPVEGGVYFGANNYQAGKLAGRALGRYAAERWQSRFDRIVLLEGPRTQTNVHARLTGVLVGLREALGEVSESRVVHVEGGSHVETSRAGMARLLAELNPRSRLLVAAFNDLSAVGAMEAVEAAGRTRNVIIVGHNAASEGRAAISRSDSCFLASVAFFPEHYGEKLVKMACSIAAGEQIPLAVYTDHVVLHSGNVHRYYANVESGS